MAETKAKMVGDEDHKRLDSGAPTTSVRYGGRYGGARRRFSMLLAVLLVVAGITALTLWLVYRPHRPKFTLVSAVIYDLNTTSPPPFISTTVQVTILTRNPNRRVSILYDHLSAHVSYRNYQVITPILTLPDLYHHRKSTVRISAVVGGAAVAVPAKVRNGLMTEQAYGMVGLRVVLVGKLRWKAAGITTSRDGVYVACDTMAGFNTTQLPSVASPCHVDI